MVVISGQVPSDLIGTDAFQETDMVGISRPVVKHSFMVRNAEEIPAVVKKAFHYRNDGPTWANCDRCAKRHHRPF